MSNAQYVNYFCSKRSKSDEKTYVKFILMTHTTYELWRRVIHM